jgi:hypothetical protein
MRGKTYFEIVGELIDNSKEIVERATLVRKLQDCKPTSIRTAIDMTLKRKCDNGELKRIGYGIYKKVSNGKRSSENVYSCKSEGIQDNISEC